MIATIQPLILPLFRTLRARWTWSLIWAVGLALTVWFFGALVAIGQHRPLESDFARFVTCVAIFAIWAALNLQINLRAHQTNRDMINDLTGPGDEEKQHSIDTASAEELRQLRERLQEALLLLRKKAGFRTARGYLYQLPWYIMIGPPGSGKSSALQTSGLTFPLSNAMGRDPLKGVGGTRNCDWWFTDEAILLDTAGRYTTQDSDPHHDQTAWLGFLDLLKTYRPRQPVNGAIVVISLADLMVPDPTERLSHARAIRQRLNELYDRFGIRFPVYMLFTKVDLVPGFVEFFEKLGRSEREQVWGVTYPLEDGVAPEAGVVGRFPAELDGLVVRLNEQLLERVQQEADIERRSLVYGFPNQVAGLADATQEVLSEIFRATPYEPSPLLRGTYFSSSVQVGAPIDRTMAAITAAFGLDPVRLPANNRQGRSYFLTRLFHDVIFAEAAVVSLNPRIEQRRRRIRVATYATAAIILAVLAYAWTSGYNANERQVAHIDAELDAYGKAIAGISETDVAEDDLSRVLPPLNILRALPTGLHNTEGATGHWLTFGLYQGHKLLSIREMVYRRALNGLLLPRLLVHLQNQIRAHQADDDYVTAALKVYLILGGRGPMDAEAVRRWMIADWATAWPGDEYRTRREDLAHHLDALLSGPMADIPLDANLIAQSRRTLEKLTPAARIYALAREREAANQSPQWRPVDHAGATADRVFTRGSGKPLTDGIPGLYTYQGFYVSFLPSLAAVIADVQNESWVRGDKATGTRPSDSLRNDVLQLYFADYTAFWDGMLNDLRVVPLGDMQQTIAFLNLVSSPDMPLLKLLRGIAAETQIGTPPAGLSETPPGAAAVTQHFQPIADLVTPANGAPARIDDLIRTMGLAYQEMRSVASAPAGGQAILLKRTSEGVGTDPVQQLASEAPQLPPPVSVWIAAVANSVSGVSVSGARAQLSDIWGGSAGNVCARAVNGRYPFTKNSTREVSVGDFARLFAPGGLLDSFFEAHLRPLVATSGKQWHWQKVGSTNLGISNSVLADFQMAAQIRDSFFPDGGQQPRVAFQVTPTTLDPKATGVLFATSGQQLEYQHGPQWPGTFQWPDQDPTGLSKIVFEVPDGTPPTVMKTGAWSLFHLIDDGAVTRLGDDRFRVAFQAGGHTVSYEIRSNSTLNPFTLNELRSFHCPTSF
ncbi:type VI secretion system membrane subunit TssM [Telmatospirillum sp.]|uniref:type VI secretion system membrane subunit TssM n=1 Tax=Telmatospirillum sp. TaxID=2079197 RepID=UPI00284B422F|nr:type VI secretion system membrane subunit TssM [Telmatospirillum sp.]MDR3435262.1 type VI secretion system membrane subunit TssM [Telmatospirillum sp.]